MGTQSKEALVSLLSTSNNNVDITSAEVDFSDLTALEGLHTGIKVTAVKGGRYRGSVDLTYHRLGLTTLFKGFEPRLDVYSLEIGRDDLILARIAERYGVKLEMDDVVIETVEVDGGFTFTVTSNAEGLQFQEEATFKAIVTKSPIDVFLLPDSDRFVYPLEFSNRTFARIYSGGWIVPEFDFELVKWAVGQVADDNLTWITRTISGNAWVNLEDLEIAYNLANAVVVYNGPVAGAALTPPTADTLLLVPEGVDNVMVVELNDRLCKNMVGNLTYYY